MTFFHRSSLIFTNLVMQLSQSLSAKSKCIYIIHTQIMLDTDIYMYMATDAWRICACTSGRQIYLNC